MTTIEEQRDLQQQADTVVDLLELMPLLSKVGNPIRVGSSAMGLMVRRDIDITVVCDKLHSATHTAVADIASRLITSSIVGSVRFRNDSGGWNADPQTYPDGLYLGVSARTSTGADWTLDIWFVDQPDRQPDLAHLKNLFPRITETDRETILAIKHELAKNGGPPKQPSALVYEAVMDHGIRSTLEFEAWIEVRGR